MNNPTTEALASVRYRAVRTVPVGITRAWLVWMVGTAVVAAQDVSSGPRDAAEEPPSIVERFDDGWTSRWMPRELKGRPNRHTIESEEGNDVLRIDSSGGATAIWWSVSLHPSATSRLSFRWRIHESLSGKERETERSGDDYAARLFVIFDPVLFDLQMRGICYVWAAKRPVGDSFPSPYSANVAMVVLRSGNEEAGTWVNEQRDVVADFERFFGESPEMITAIALMSDTDNSKESATAWFDDIELVP